MVLGYRGRIEQGARMATSDRTIRRGQERQIEKKIKQIKKEMHIGLLHVESLPFPTRFELVWRTLLRKRTKLINESKQGRK